MCSISTFTSAFQTNLTTLKISQPPSVRSHRDGRLTRRVKIFGITKASGNARKLSCRLGRGEWLQGGRRGLPRLAGELGERNLMFFGFEFVRVIGHCRVGISGVGRVIISC